MTIKTKSVLIFVALGLGILLISFYVTPTLECEYTIRSEANSPDGYHKAAILDVACGATTKDTSWILLQEAGKSFQYEKNRIAVFEGHVARAFWEKRKLVVIYEKAIPFLFVEQVNDVEIEYRKFKNGT